jgi:iron complex transport system substrate-binding protein
MRMHLSATSARLVARVFVFCALTPLAVAGCQATSGNGQTSTSSTFPVAIPQPGRPSVTLAHEPHRIVSLSATATEMLFAIGAGKQVVAVDDQSNFPASAPMTKLSESQPNVEAIVGYSPDLVVTGGDTAGLVAGLASVRVPTLLEPAAKTLDDTYREIRELGTATGHLSAAESVVARMRADIAAVLASVGSRAHGLSVYHELDDTHYSVTSHTFIGQVYSLLGLRNIADLATGAAPDYPQLSAEFIVSASPDVIVLADTKCCQQTPQVVATRPGWQSISAVRSGRIVSIDDDIASRWGPRVVDFMRAVAARVVGPAATPSAGG